MNLFNQLILNPAFFAQAGPDVPAQPVAAAAVPVGAWTSAMMIPIVFGALGYLFIQYGVVKSRAFVGAGAVSLLIAVGVALGFTPCTFESYVLIAFFAVATGGGVGFLTAESHRVAQSFLNDENRLHQTHATELRFYSRRITPMGIGRKEKLCVTLCDSVVKLHV